MTSSHLKSAKRTKTEVKKLDRHCLERINLQVQLFPVCNQVTDYKASPMARVAVCSRDLKGESIVKQYDNTCLFARAATEKGLITPFSSPAMHIIFSTMSFLNKRHCHLFFPQPIKEFPSLDSVSQSPSIYGENRD